MPINRPGTRAARRGRPALTLAALITVLLAGSAFATATAGAVIFRPELINENKQRADSMKRLNGVFKVKVEGVQTNRWTESKDAGWECDVASTGSGSERIRFSTPFRRMRISAFGEKRADSAIFAPLSARGTVTRAGKRDQTPAHLLPEHCLADGGGDPPPPPPAPDCGTKRIKGVQLSLGALGGKLTLDRTRSRRTPPQLFTNCTWSGLVWPNLLTRKGNGKEISTPFSPRSVFNPRFNARTGEWSKVIMIARGTRTGRSFGTTYTTTIRWTATLKRLS